MLSLAYRKDKVHFRLEVKLKQEVMEQIMTKDYLFRNIICLLMLETSAFDLGLGD